MADEVLNTDDPDRDGNLTAEEYNAAWLERIERAGDSGLHIIPAEYLEGTDGEDR